MEKIKSANSKEEHEEEARIAQAIIECTYCRIKPSEVHGVGVFAVRDVASNTNLFPETSRYDKFFKVPEKVFDVADEEVKSMVLDFFSKSQDSFVYIPYRTLNTLNISAYMNHSDNPNARFDANGSVYAMFDISRGEEVFIKYDNFFQGK
jgi:SET domain-containing protein